jgi:23S rRNA pseudouridine1911/1915/1917 synthase
MGRPNQAGQVEPTALEPEETDDAAEAAADEPESRAARVETAVHGERLDRWLVALAGEFSRSHLQTLIADGLVQVDGRVVTTPARRVSAGQRIEVVLRQTAESRAFRPEAEVAARWRIVHEDAALLVIDKPAGLVVHPAPGNWSGTLLNGLLAHHTGAARLPRAGIVHRLDKDTSGLLVVAKTLAAQTALTRAIAARAVRREYLALAHGEPRQLAWTVDAPIGRDPVSRVRMAVVAGGKPARTDVECLAARDGLSALRCRLHTGRTHQIRVHLASCGHALVADVLYGGRPALGLERQALHAARLAFAHPDDGRALDFTAPLPADLAAAWQQVAPGIGGAATMAHTG